MPQTIDRMVYVKHNIPDDLLECRNLPTEPVAAVKQSEVAGYIVELWLTADECKRNLLQVKDLVDTNGSR